MKYASTLTDTAPAGFDNPPPTRQPLPGWGLRIGLVSMPLALFAVIAFIPILNNGFVNWDDDKNLLDNPYFRGLGPAQIRWAWTTFRLAVYQPLAWLLFESQYVCWKLNPYGYHLTSIILHAANAVALYLLTVALLRRCQPDLWLTNPWTCALGAGFTTALFMVHPLRVEAVAWVSCQPYLPCAFFSMLAVLAYLHAFEAGSDPRRGWLVATFVFFVAALLFHAVAISLPAVLLILDIYPLRRFEDGPGRWLALPAWRAWREKVPFILASLVFIGLAIAARRESVFADDQCDVAARIAQACYGTWFYLWKTVLPLDLSAVYPLPQKIDWLAPKFLLSIVGTLAISAGLFLLRRRWPALLAAWLSYLVILAPNSGLVRIGKEITADRYSYMAMLGWAIVLAACLCRLGQSFSRSRLAAMGIMALGLPALAGLLLMTWNQCRTWRDSRTLWTHARTHGAGLSSRVHSGLGIDFERRGNLQAATTQFAQAVQLDPRFAEAYYNLGVILGRQGKNAEAATQFAKAVQLDPQYLDAHYNLGIILSRQGKNAKAATQFAEVLKRDPASAKAHYQLGVVLSRLGNDAEAAAHYTEALWLNLGLTSAHNNLGVILARQGRDADAAVHYAAVLQLDPHSADAHYNLAMILSRLGRDTEAAAHYLEALQLNPDAADAHYNLAMILSRQRKYSEAETHYTAALRLNPGLADAHNNLGTNLARQGKLPEAEAHYREALRLDPRRADTHTNLGIILSRQGKFEEAATHYTEALRVDPGYGEARKHLEMDRGRRTKVKRPPAQ